MTPDSLFQLSSPLALAGWAVLALSPLAPKSADLIAGLAIPALLAIAYAALILAFWSGASGGFDSLPNVMALFTSPRSPSPAGCTTSPSTSSSAPGRSAPPAARRSRTSSCCPASRSPSCLAPRACSPSSACA